MVKAATAQRHAATADVLAADVGKRIREARTARGMSLAELGGEDLSRSFLSLVELGRSRISLRALSIVARRLELPVSHFLADSAVDTGLAAELLLDQAEIALGQRNPEESLRLLNSDTVPDALRVRERWLRGRALSDLAQHRDAIPLLEEALGLAEQGDDPHLTLSVRYTLAGALYQAHNYDEALRLFRDSLTQVMHEGNDPKLVAKFTVAIGHTRYVQGAIDDALDSYARARQLYDKLGDMAQLAAVYSGLSRSYEHKGDLVTALRYSRMAVGILEAHQDLRQAAAELNNLATHYEEMGKLDEARDCALRAIERARQSHATDYEAVAHSTLASILFRLDDLAGAESEAREALDLAREDHTLASVYAWLVLARIAACHGDTGQTDNLYQRSLDRLEAQAHHTLFADTALAYSLHLQQRGDMQQALTYALKAAQAKSTRPA